MVKRKNLKNRRTKKIIKKTVLFILFLLLLVSTIYVIYDYSSSKFKANKNSYKSDNRTPSSNSKEPSAQNNIPPKNKVNRSLLLSSVGDCTIGSDTKFGTYSTLPTILQQNNNDYSYFFKNVAHIFKSDDITTANLETTFTNSTDRAIKTFVFKGSPEYAKALTIGGIDAVNLSNNHIYDYKQKGFDDTVEALKSNNIEYFGEGNKLLKNINGVKIGFLGYMGFNDNEEFLQKVKSDIQELKSNNYIVVINFHWGVESQYEPIQSQRNIARFSIDNGADLIVGHHPHVIQTIEKYKDKMIFYSLGNFCFGGNTNPSDKDTFILQTKFNIEDDTLKSYDIKIIPCSISSRDNINDYSPIPLDGDNKIRVINKINTLSPNLGFNITDTFTNVVINN